MYRCNSNILHCNVIDSMTMSRFFGYHDCTNVVVQIKIIA